MQAVPANSLVPFATVAAALIAGFFSFLNLVISKEQKVSEFRQAWIDELREDISQYVSSITYLASTNQVWIAEGRQQALEYHKAMQSSFESATQHFTSILLRVNPLDSDTIMKPKNEEFLSRLISVRDAVRNDDYKGARKLADTLSDLAQPILKHEWERVKKGERIYRLTRYAAAALIVIGLLAGSVLAYHAYHNVRVQAVAPANPPLQPTR
jgi:hypothetical protein